MHSGFKNSQFPEQPTKHHCPHVSGSPTRSQVLSGGREIDTGAEKVRFRMKFSRNLLFVFLLMGSCIAYCQIPIPGRSDIDSGFGRLESESRATNNTLTLHVIGAGGVS